MESKGDLSGRSMIVTIFCLSASFEAGYILKTIVSRISAWQTVAYAIGAGIFIAISAVFLHLFLEASGGK